MPPDQVDRSVFSWINEGHRLERNQSHVSKTSPSCRGHHGPQPAIGYHLFHGTHPNTDSSPRELIQFGYRPAWAGPVQPMDEWDEEWVASLPDHVKPFVQSLNTTGGVWGLEHKPKGMTTDAPGINPSRWDS